MESVQAFWSASHDAPFMIILQFRFAQSWTWITAKRNNERWKKHTTLGIFYIFFLKKERFLLAAGRLRSYKWKFAQMKKFTSRKLLEDEKAKQNKSNHDRKLCYLFMFNFSRKFTSNLRADVPGNLPRGMDKIGRTLVPRQRWARQRATALIEKGHPPPILAQLILTLRQPHFGIQPKSSCDHPGFWCDPNENASGFAWDPCGIAAHF